MNQISFFGYPTFEDYREAAVSSCLASGAKRMADEFAAWTRESHRQSVLRTTTRTNFFDSILQFVHEEWRRDPTYGQGSSFGWYFHHPDTRPLIDPEFLSKVDAICGPMKPIFV